MDDSHLTLLNIGIIHYPQCSCNFQNMLRKTIRSVFHLEIYQQSCHRAKKWCELANLPENSEAFYLNLLKINFDKEVLSQSNRQIELDIPRTFSDYTYFAKGSGIVILQRILYAFIKYNPKLGYVQGMNYIAASLLYHCSESDAFWLFLRLVYDYDLVGNYLPMLPGLDKHSHVMEFLMMESLPDLNEHLLQCGIVVQMFITEWCITLFTSLLNLNYSHIFFSKFFKYKWVFFYKFVLEILDRLSYKIMQTHNTMKILDLLKPMRKNTEKSSLIFLKNLETDEKLTWEKLAKIAEQRVINEEAVFYLTENFEVFSQVSSEKYYLTD
jgi:Rab-GTPase-TBC domain